MKACLLIIWLALDIVQSIFFIGGGVYLALWKHCSGWWVVLGIIISMSFGGGQLYKSFRMFICADGKEKTNDHK